MVAEIVPLHFFEASQTARTTYMYNWRKRVSLHVAAFGSSSAPGCLSNLLSGWGHNIKTPACLQGSDFWLNVKRSSAPCGVDPRPCDACGAAVAADPTGVLRHSTRTKNSFLVWCRDLLRHHHNLSQGARCVLPWPLSPAHAHTDITCSLGPAAHDATNHYTCGLLCLQVLGRDDQPTGAACLCLCMSSACTSSSRWMELLCVYRSVARAAHIVRISAIMPCQPASRSMHSVGSPRAICEGARQSTLGVCDSMASLACISANV